MRRCIHLRLRVCDRGRVYGTGGGVKSAKVRPTPYVYFPPVVGSHLHFLSICSFLSRSDFCHCMVCGVWTLPPWYVCAVCGIPLGFLFRGSYM
jgi:hypothetical protein